MLGSLKVLFLLFCVFKYVSKLEILKYNNYLVILLLKVIFISFFKEIKLLFEIFVEVMIFVLK